MDSLITATQNKPHHIVACWLFEVNT